MNFAGTTTSIVLSWVTYKLIERPIRFGKYAGTKTIVLFALMVVIGLVGYGTYKNDGLHFRKDAFLQDGRNGDIGHVEYHRYIANKYYLCTPEEIANDAPKFEGYVRCMQSKPGNDVDIALLGDSHAEHLFIGMAEALPGKNIVFYIKGDPPFLGHPDFIKIYESVINSKSIKTVVLTMHWVGRNSQVPQGSTLDAELIKIVDLLLKAGKKVYLTDDVPAFPFSPEKCKGGRRFAMDTVCDIPYAVAKSQNDIYLGFLMKVIESRPSVRILPVGKYLCNVDACSMASGNSVLYRDRSHLNINGSSLVGRRLVADNQDLFQ